MVITVSRCLKHSQFLIIIYIKLVALSNVKQMVNYLRVISNHSLFCLQTFNVVFVYLGPAICAQLILDK